MALAGHPGAEPSPLWSSFSDPTPEGMQKYYDQWANAYDEDVLKHGYNGWKYVGELFEKYVPNKEAYILCVGAGTGLEGVRLAQLGYKNMDAHDGSAEMLKVAEHRALFKRCMHELLAPEPKQSQFKTDEYDALVCVGCFVKGGLDERHFEDMIRPVKNGGIMVIGTREMFVRPNPSVDYPYDLEKRIEKCVQQGRLQLLERVRKEQYSEGMPGVFFILKVIK